MIEKLTKEQEDKFQEYVDKWIKIGTSTEPTDKATTEEGIREAYKAAGLKAPGEIFWCSSPKEAIEKYKVDLSYVFCGQYEASWLASYEFYHHECKIDCSALFGLIKIAKSAGWCWFFEDYAIATERINRLKRDTQGRLHCEDGPAVSWPDGWKLYFWHGIAVPANLIEPLEEFPIVEFFQKERNQEQRRAACEKLGWGRICNALGAKEIQRDDYGILLETSSLADDNGRPAKFVRVKDYSTEREYVIRTHPDTRSAHDGVARLWRLTADQFNPQQRA